MYQIIVLFYALPCIGAAALVIRDVLAPYPVWRAGLMAWLLAGAGVWLWLLWGQRLPAWGEWLLDRLHLPQDTAMMVAPAAVLAAPVALVISLLARSYYSE